MIQLNKEISEGEFKRLSNFIYSNYGIKMPEGKKGMLQARLQNRLKANNLSTFKEYCDLIFSANGGDSEIVHMIDMVSTNKTDFFRESAHFDYMLTDVLPEFTAQKNAGELKIWSSACSSGEEVYTIGMTIREFQGDASEIKYSVLGTDISTRILERAKNAVYSEERVANIPMSLKKKYLLRSKDRENPTVKVVADLRTNAFFQRLNLMDNEYKTIPRDHDIVFCRNVLIYFDRETQEKVINKLCTHLKPGGYFFLGHSESVTGMNVPLKQVRPTIFRKIG